MWNSLPVHVVNSSSVNSFKNNLDRFCSNQEVYYNFRCDITATGNRSFESELIKVCYKEVDIEASKPASSTPIRYDTIYAEMLHCMMSKFCQYLKQ